MESKTSRFVVLLMAALSLNACSGLVGAIQPQSGSGSVLALTVRAIPLVPPPNTNILSFSVTLLGVSIVRSTGESINVPLNSSSQQADLARLQSDSAFLGASASVQAGTYSSLAVSLANPMVTYCAQTSETTGCATSSVTTVRGEPAVLVLTTAPFPLNVAADHSTGMAVTLNIGAALSLNPATHVVTGINFGAVNVLGATLLPPSFSNLPPNAFDFIEDVTGIVTSVNTSAQTVTVQTATGGSIAATAGPATIVSPNCIALNLGTTFTCAKQGQVASVDTTLNSDGTFSLLEYDPLATTPGDWIEGIIDLVPSSSSRFQLVVNNLVLAPSNSLIGGNLALGSGVTVNLVNPKPFVIDTKGLDVPTTSFSGATDSSILQPGQTVAVHVTTFMPASGTTPAVASADSLYLRFTRVTGSVAGAAPPNTFDMQSFPAFFGLTIPATVQLSMNSPSTSFDGVADASGLVTEQPVSIRALYFGLPTSVTPTPTPFSAAKVRRIR